MIMKLYNLFREGSDLGRYIATAVVAQVDRISPSAEDLLFQAARDGHRVLLIEPIARGAARWWADWHREALVEGGRADEWRFQVELPELLTRLDRAAGLDHRELTARSLALGF